MDLLTTYIIHQADNTLILGHRNSEWTGHGPILEQDIALSNIALDLIGQSRNFYQLAATMLNDSEPLQNITEDDLAFMRNTNEFRNLLLVEQENGDWARTILRQFYFSTYQFLIFNELINSSNPEIAAISEKSIKETRYHIKWSSEWVIRLGDGTEESHSRMLNAIQTLEPFIEELFSADDFDYGAEESGAGILPGKIRGEWFEKINGVFKSATLPFLSSEKKPKQHLSGKKGIHSEYLQSLLEEMQFLQRTYPGSEW